MVADVKPLHAFRIAQDIPGRSEGQGVPCRNLPHFSHTPYALLGI